MDVTKEDRQGRPAGEAGVSRPGAATLHDLAADWAAALVLAGFAVLVLVLATPLASFSTFGPGPGFFAQYLGATLLGLVLVQLAMLSMRSFRPRWRARRAEPAETGGAAGVSRGDVVRFFVMAAALFAYPPLLRPIGFVAATALLAWVLLAMLGRAPVRAAVEAVLSVVVLKLAFTRLLGVPLPEMPIEFLARLGL